MWALSHNLNATVNVIAFGPGAVPPINNPADRWSCSNDGVFEVNRVDIKCTKRKEGAAPAPVSTPVPAPVPAPIPSPSKPSKPSPSSPSSPSSPVSDLFSSTTNPFPTSTSFIDHVTPLLTTALTVCQNTTLPTFLSTYSPLPDFPANLGATGNPFCRGRNYLYQNTDIVTGVLHVTPPSQYVANSYNYLVLYPCTADATNDLSTFHKTTYWAGFHGAGLITPIITPLTLPLPGHDSFPIFVLSFRPLIPGSYVLNILPRWVHDTMDLDTPLLFTGESEKRACPGPDGRKGSPGKWCLNRANGGRSEWNCRLQGVLVDAAVTVGENESNPPPSFKDLPLTQNGDSVPDGFWVRVGDNLADCKAGKRAGRYFTGNPCQMSKTTMPDEPVYAWQPSDRRLHYYTPDEAGACFKERAINWIAFQGDSVARGAFVTMPQSVADFVLNPTYAEDLKQELHKKQSGLYNGVEFDGLGGLKVSYTQEWDEKITANEKGVSTVSDLYWDNPRLSLFKSGPDAFVYNGGAPAHKQFETEAFAKAWSDRASEAGATPPLLKLFLLPATVQGMRNVGWSRMNHHARAEKLEVTAKAAGFATVKQEQMSMGWMPEFTDGGDGFHYNANVMLNLDMVIINMVCNADKEMFSRERIHEWYALGGKLVGGKAGEKDTIFYDFEFEEYVGKNGQSVQIVKNKASADVKESVKGDALLVPYNVVDLHKFKLFDK